MATLYFNAAVDNDWSTLGNWWTDPSCVTPYEASSLPSSSDDVIINANCTSNIGSLPTIHSLTVNYATLTVPMIVGDSILNDGSATFNGTSVIGTYAAFPYYSWIYGPIVFNDYSNIGGSAGGIIYSEVSCTFNYESYNGGGSNIYSVNNSTITFNDSSTNNGYAGDNAGSHTITFNGSSKNIWTTSGNGVQGTTIFNDSSVNGDPSYNTDVNSIVTGDCTFNNYSTNKGTVTGNCIFNNNTVLWSTINGNVTFNNDSYAGGYTVGGYDKHFGNSTTTINGTATFNDNSYNNAIINNANNGGIAVVFNGFSTHGNSSFSYAGTINGSAIFNNSSKNLAVVTDYVTFNNTSFNDTTGTVCFALGDAIFNDDSFNLGTISGGTTTWNGFTGINIYNRFTGGQINATQGGTLYFNVMGGGDWNVLGHWWIDNAFSLASPSLPIADDSVMISSPLSSNSGGSISVVNLTTFNQIDIIITVTQKAIFDNVGAINTGTINCANVLFINGATNQSGTVGVATFDITSAYNMIYYGYDGTYSLSPGVIITYEKGINGSSILGIV